jgi:hypothetical protein
MATPGYHSPIVGSPYSVSDVTQFLGTHAATLLNQGLSKVSYIVASSASQSTNTGAAAQWLAQPFTTAALQTTITRIELALQGSGTFADTTLELRTDNAGVPSNTILWSCNIPADFIASGAVYLSIPCNVSGLTAATKYHIVLDGTASTTNYDTWVTAVTSVNAGLKSASGTAAWSSVATTFLFNVFNGTNGALRNIVEDCPAGGPPARWVGLDYANTTRVVATGALPTNAARDGNSVPTVVREVCGVLRSVRTLTYTAGVLTSVA